MRTYLVVYTERDDGKDGPTSFEIHVGRHGATGQWVAEMPAGPTIPNCIASSLYGCLAMIDTQLTYVLEALCEEETE